MLMEHSLCDDVGGKLNVCEMEFIVTNLVYLYDYQNNYSK